VGKRPYMRPAEPYATATNPDVHGASQ